MIGQSVVRTSGDVAAVQRAVALVSALTLDEKAGLLAGVDHWRTLAIERLGIPSWTLTDGPAGARGSSTGGADMTAACVPCGSALGSTWNVELVEEVGAMLGEEARSKAARVLLAPTINLHRSPLCGRTFESYSEDPLLSGSIAAAVVRGVQSEGVIATVKHFVANETEFERFTTNSVVDERTLRELYLLPFEMAISDGGALGVMTGYNRVNGRWCSEDADLLSGILRREWGFAGIVMTDWWAVASTIESIRAGVDLEMPGPGRAYGPALAAAVRDGEVDEALVDAAAERLLTVFGLIDAFDDGEQAEQAIDLPRHRALARRAAAESIVLLRNTGVLPLDMEALRSVAVIGPNAQHAQIMGGGSAGLLPHYLLSPLTAIRDRVGAAVDVRYAAGCSIERRIPGNADLTMAVEVFAGHTLEGVAVRTYDHPGTDLFQYGAPSGLDDGPFSLRASCTLLPATTGVHDVALSQAGWARVLVDGTVVVDSANPADPTCDRHEDSGQLVGRIPLESGRAARIVVEYADIGTNGYVGFHVGIRPTPPAATIEAAAELASACDAAVVIVGTTAEWESEGFDRASLDLPGPQDALVRAVVAANPNSVVVINTGTPVALPWADEAPAIVQAWLGGQEMANALVDILLGTTDPAGRLATTFPERIEHTPAFGNFPGDNGDVLYGERGLVGYRWYEARHLPTRFPFGHGLSYTSFALTDASLSAEGVTVGELAAGQRVTVTVHVTNTGARRGAEVVQCYVAPRSSRVTRAPKELKGFAKVWLDPGESCAVTIHLDERSFAYWNAVADDWEVTRARPPLGFMSGSDAGPPRGWTVDPGEYDILVGRSSAEIAQRAVLAVLAVAPEARP